MGENPEREQTTIPLPIGMKEELQQEADKRGISFNALVLMLLNVERTHHQKE